MGQGYYTITRITDYGPYVTKIILPVPQTVKEGQVKPEQFSVYVERMDEKGEILSLPKSWMAPDDKEPSKGFIPVTGAYPSDIDGNSAESGGFITLEMAYGPLMQLSASICAPNGFNVYIKSRYRITQTVDIETAEGKLAGLFYDFLLGNQSPDAAGFLNSTSSYEPEPLNYGYFIPQDVEVGKRPLIVWLHGAGEGGVDATIAYTGNKVVRLASPEVQKLFGGAYILAPQTKTFWLNDGSGEYGRTGKSMYVEALKATIDEFVEKNENIDRDRIFIGGDSNGGFMTMRMIVDYPEFFAAAFPICEALYDELISDQDIENIRHLPIWFTHAKNDPVVDPNETVVPTYKRLIAAGAPDVHFTFWDNVKDIHEGFKDADGNPYEYFGHFTWIPMLNDDCKVDFDGKPVCKDGKEVTLLEWLATQKKA